METSLRAVGSVLSILAVATACGGPSATGGGASSGAAPTGSPGSTTSSSSSSSGGASPEKPDPFRATGGPGDAVCAFVRPERSSHLDVAGPRGTHARATFRAPLDPALQPVFVLAAGNRVVVVGKSAWVAFDDHGRPVGNGKNEGASADVRIDRGGGAVASALDDRVAKLDVSHKVAVHGEHVAIVSQGSFRVLDRGGDPRAVVEGTFEGLGVAIDDAAVAHALVRTDTGELAIWSAPVTYGGSVGRKKLGRFRHDHADVPPILGRTMQVVVLDDRILAVAPDGKRLWERIGALTGGATMTADDRLLAASDATVIAIDVAGKVTKLVDEPRVVFVTPPILDVRGALLVASGQTLHGYSFD